MLNKQEIKILKENAKVHKEVFDEIKKILKDWTKATEVNELCWQIAKKYNVLCWFKWVYGFPDNICISVNDVVVHGRCLPEIIFKDWDLVTFDFWIKDKKFWINTDAAFSVVIGWDEKNLKAARLIEANKKALEAWISMAKPWNTTWDIWAAIQKVVEQDYWYKIVKELTGHAVWKKLHEKPYIYNYGKPGTGQRLKVWMVLAIEPILWETSWEIIDHGDWEIYIKDWSLWSQYEHTILIGENWPEIII